MHIHPRWWKSRSIFLRSADGREVKVVRKETTQYFDEEAQTEKYGFNYWVEWPDQPVPQKVYSWEVFDGATWYEAKRVEPYWGPEKNQIHKQGLDGGWYPKRTVGDLTDEDMGKWIELEQTHPAPFYRGRITLVNHFSRFWGQSDLAITSLSGSYGQQPWPDGTICIVREYNPANQYDQ